MSTYHSLVCPFFVLKLPGDVQVERELWRSSTSKDESFLCLSVWCGKPQTRGQCGMHGMYNFNCQATITTLGAKSGHTCTIALPGCLLYQYSLQLLLLQNLSSCVCKDYLCCICLGVVGTPTSECAEAHGFWAVAIITAIT
jgi:hypothetical protein